MDTLTFLLLIAGLALLVVGAEVLLRGGTRLATAARISPLVIGLTVVAFGTSAPEMAVSVLAASSSDPISRSATWSAATSTTCFSSSAYRRRSRRSRCRGSSFGSTCRS